jgi:hypothetical protein
MPRRSSRPRPPAEDANQAAFRVVRELTDERGVESAAPEKRRKNPAAVALGRLGGRKGGKARAERLTPERRREIARNAAKKRWAKRDERG